MKITHSIIMMLNAVLIPTLWANTAPRMENQPSTQFNINETQTHPTDNTPNLPQTTNTPTMDVNEAQLLAQPELLKHAMFSALMMRQVAALRELLPIYRKLPENLHDADTPIFLALGQAQLAQADGEYRQAIQLYRKILQDYPDFALARLSLAQSLFEDRYFDQAKQEFEIIQKDSETPEAMRALIRSYLQSIERQEDWQFGMGANYVRDSNINNAPKNRSFQRYGGTWTMPAAESAQGFAYHVSAEKAWRLRDQWSAKTDVSAQGKFYWDNHRFDDLNVRFQAGLQRESARNEVAVLPFVSKRWYGTKQYSWEKGVRLEGAHWLNRQHRVFAATEYGRELYRERKHLDGKNFSASATWLYAPNAKQFFTLGSDFSRKKTQDASDAYKRVAVRGSWTRQWSDNGFFTALSLDYGRRKYDAADFFNIIRKDKELSSSLTLWHQKFQYKGIVPRLTVTHQKVKSNHPVYGYQKPNAFVQLRKTF